LALGICPVALAVGDLEEAQRGISLLLDYSRRHSLDYWCAWAHAYDAVLNIQRKSPNGLGALEAALDGTTTGSRFAQNFLPFLALLAETFVSEGNLDKASAAIDTALERCERDEAYWFISEILRVKGLVALRHDPVKAEEYFLRSLEYARNQQALAWELRTTMSFAQAQRGQRRTDKARDMLASLYARFNEGFETADLRAAKRLLDELR
jgi:predicted ATPase